MTISEILKAAGLTDDAIKTVLDTMRQNKIFTASEENMDIRYGKIKEQHDGQAKQLAESLALIETMKKETKGQEDLQKKIAESQTRMAQLEKENLALRAESGMDRMLIAAGARQSDLDYLKFQWRKKGEISFDENGEIKSGEDTVAALRVQCPSQFAGGANRTYDEHRLPEDAAGGEAITRESILKKPYAERMKLYSENPEAYKAAMNNNGQ